MMNGIDTERFTEVVEKMDRLKGLIWRQEATFVPDEERAKLEEEVTSLTDHVVDLFRALFPQTRRRFAASIIAAVVTVDNADFYPVSVTKDQWRNITEQTNLDLRLAIERRGIKVEKA